VIRFNVQTLAAATAFLCEILGLLSLLFSADVEKGLLSILVGVGLVISLLRLRLSNQFLRLLMVLVVVGSAAFALKSHLPVAIPISRGLVFAHVMLWLAKDFANFRYWRLGIGFVEVVLAAILTPETHMFFFIFFFTVAAALSLSFGFLENRLRKHQPRELLRPISPKLVMGVLFASLCIFLTSLVIFPILPRSNWEGNNNQWTEAGYTENVGFLSGTLRWARGTPRPMVWLFKEDQQNWQSLVPFGLLRGRILEQFNGVDWLPGTNEMGSPKESIRSGSTLRAQRESMDSEVLLVPYGAVSVSIGGLGVTSLKSGEWPAHRWRNKRISYDVQLGGKFEFFSPPKKANLQVGIEEQRYPDFWKLVRQLSRGKRSDNEKIQAVRAYLKDFSYSLEAVPGVNSQKRHPIEIFLLEQKKGHCELFATGAALLLRAMNVPTRLVVGFRTSSRNGNILKVTNQDAHAWLEVYSEKTGWFPLDLTPSLPPAEQHWFSELGNIYDWVNVYWNQYILGYEFDSRELFIQARNLGSWALLGFLVLAALRFVLRKRPVAPRASVQKLRRRWERKKLFQQFVATEVGQKVFADYKRARFSREEPDQSQLINLDRRFQEEYRRYELVQVNGDGKELSKQFPPS
jgi:hypothetical protein